MENPTGPLHPEADSAAAEEASAASGSGVDASEQCDAVKPVAVVGLGASAGGLQAYLTLFRAMPPDTGLTFVVVQHLAPKHESMLAELLSRATTMQVVEVHDQPHIQPNTIYVIPPNREMVITDGMLSLSPRPPGVHHPIDLFFSALAESHGSQAIGVVLSGTASDGTLGLQAIKAAGGITFAQDASASHVGMPSSAIESGCVDSILPPQEIAMELARFARHPYVSVSEEEPSLVADKLDMVLAIMRRDLGVDFTQYKPNTLQRRIRRRMALRKFATLPEYTAFLETNPQEVESLYQDVLISVTNFFRNPECFEALREQVFPLIFAERDHDAAVRVWVLGCSTGEEAYSLAIALTEYAEEHGQPARIAVYATDLNNSSIERARKGWYPKSIAEEVSPQRLQRFFREMDGGYCVSKAIREKCIFAKHNVLTDPPFARIDLVTCRNLLIYLDSSLQKRLLAVLNYALKPSGFLFLGQSETITQQRELFEVEDAKHKIYSKRLVSAGIHASLPITVQTSRRSERFEIKKPELARELQAELHREAERALLSKYVPPGVLINSDADVLQFRGDTGLYLSPAPGKANLNLLKMAREGLLVPLRSALMQAEQGPGMVRAANIQVRSNGSVHHLGLSIVPVRPRGSHERWYWVLFEPEREPPSGAEPGAEPAEGRSAIAAAQEQTQRLTQELEATREYLQAVIEEYEAADSELQSENEEVQSTNEELQSINEELETSKEEVQSSNEELTTVNEELRLRNEELNRANDDLNNLFNGVQMAVVMVWNDLRIRRFTPLAEKTFNLIPTDVGRLIGDIKLNLDCPDLAHVLAEVIGAVRPQEMEVQDRAGHWYLLRVRPYVTLDNKIDGAVIVLMDINLLKRGQALQVRQARMLEQVHEAIFAWDPDTGKIVYWNSGAIRLYGYSAEEAVGQSCHELLHTQDPKLSLVALERRGHWSGEHCYQTKSGDEIFVESIQVLIRESESWLVLETDHDVTLRKRLEHSLRARVEELADADRHKNEFLAMLAHELRNPIAPLLSGVQLLGTPNIDEAVSVKARALIERQVHNITHLVSDLLDAAYVTRGEVTLRTKTLDLRPVLERSVEVNRPSFDANGHTLALRMPEAPVLVEGDTARLEQAFGNILSNAGKYTPNGGRIEVQLEVRPSSSDAAQHEAVVCIRDNGIGIDRELLPRVFELFVHGDRSLSPPPALASTSGGLGIGLSLVRTLIELHGGHVSIRSEGGGQGSEVVVSLPTAAYRG